MKICFVTLDGEHCQCSGKADRLLVLAPLAEAVAVPPMVMMLTNASASTSENIFAIAAVSSWLEQWSPRNLHSPYLRSEFTQISCGLLKV